MSSDTVQKVKDALPIEEVIGSYVKLERAGKNMRARCPFHNEKTPSFYVTPDRGMFKCFGCGKGGDIFSFVQEIEGLDFYGTLKLLAQKAGIQLTHEQSTGHQHSVLYDILELAQKWYEVQLRQTPEVVQYLLDRGLTKETIIKFHVGYAPAKNIQDNGRTHATLYELLRHRGFTDQDIVATGLCSRGERGDYYDRFRERIMFPINDSQGRVVAFSGRIFPLVDSTTDISKTGKYVNSPEGALYNKSKILFGYDRAKRNILSTGHVIIVEGQIDLLMAHQAGTTQAVALSGTALTPEHCKLIKRFTDSIVLALDGDDAGIAAAGRSVGIAYQEDMDVRVVLLPMGKDPADIITSSPEQWKEILATPRDYIDVRLELITHDPKIINTTDRFKVMREHIFPFIGMVRNAIFKDTYVQKIASQLGSDITAVRAEYRRWADANPVISQTTSNNTSSIHAGVPAVSAKNPVSSMVSAQTSSSSLVPRDMVIGLIEILKPQHDMAAYVQRFNELHLDAHTSYEQMIQDMGPLLDELILRVQAKNIPEDTLLETLAGALELVELEKLQTQRQILRAQLSATQGEEHNHIVRELEIITKKIDEERGRMNRG